MYSFVSVCREQSAFVVSTGEKGDSQVANTLSQELHTLFTFTGQRTHIFQLRAS